ncbi:MAG: coproporphyrinogen-III oxidase family protein, partial [Clostridia bacterium]|nr:coproporphyrinogen-III oxidase family protein [Clostridia bacterium]
ILKAIGRVHSHKDFIDCIKLLRLGGINNISCDIMLGLPYQTLNDIKQTVEEIINLNIPHVSAYGLKVEKGTKLYEAVKKEQITLPSDDLCADMYDYVNSELKKNKIYRYEISNFAAAGFKCRHNINYWRAGQYLGFGASAHSYINNVRCNNISDIKSYINGQTKCNKTALTKKDREFEYIMLNLRLASGINLREYKLLFEKDFISAYSGQLKKLKDFFAVSKHSVSVNDRGFYVLNSLLCEFM